MTYSTLFPSDQTKRTNKQSDIRRAASFRVGVHDGVRRGLKWNSENPCLAPIENNHRSLVMSGLVVFASMLPVAGWPRAIPLTNEGRPG